MQSKFVAVAVVCLGALLLTACGQQEEQVEVEPSPEPAAVYDLSPASNAQFLAENAAREDVIIRPSGLQYRVITAGNGEPLAAIEDTVTVSYSGKLIDGIVFDETSPGEPISFSADGLIAGWVEALSLMKVGDHWELDCSQRFLNDAPCLRPHRMVAQVFASNPFYFPHVVTSASRIRKSARRVVEQDMVIG